MYYHEELTPEQFLNKYLSVIKQLSNLYSSFMIGGSFGLYLQGVQDRLPNDIDIIVPYNESRVIKHWNYDFGLVYQHDSLYISDVKIDLMSMQDNYWKLSKYYDHRIKADVQIYPQIHYCIQYALDNELTSSPEKRIFDLESYNNHIQQHSNKLHKN